MVITQRQKGSSSNMTNRRRDKAQPPPSTSRKRSERKDTRRLPPAAAADVQRSSESVDPPLKPKKKSVALYLEDLLQKKGFDREEALAAIIEGLCCELEHEYNLVEEKFATFLYRSLNSLTKGTSSSMEKQQALKVIGLLAIIVDSQDKLSELYRELLPLLSKSLKSGQPASTTARMLDCLAIVAFFGAANSDDSESAMQIVWKFINNSESGENHPAEVLIAGVYAWLFLLTSMEGWRVSHNYWKGAISYFSNLFENDDKLVRVAASEALAVIFETGSFEKFWSEGKDLKYSHMEPLLREMILKKVKCLYLDIKNAKKSAIKVRRHVKYFENFCCPAMSLSVNGKDLKLSSWYQMIQLEFLKGFLSDGFKNHMKKNEKLQNLFEFNPCRNKNFGPELYVSTTDKIGVRFFLPEEKNHYMLMKEDIKKERVWRMSIFQKARTQLMNKHRLLSTETDRFCDDFEKGSEGWKAYMILENV